MSKYKAPIVTDGERLTCAARAHELFTRFSKSVYLNPQQVLDGLQRLIEGKPLSLVPVVVGAADEVGFATATPRSLGFEMNPLPEDLFDEVNLAKHGLELCNPDDGPSIVSVYANQPEGEGLLIAMRPPMRYPGSVVRMFCLKWDDLRTSIGEDLFKPKQRIDKDRKLIFRIRKD